MRIALTAAAAVLLLTANPASAIEARPSLTDIEDEVMCPICGTVLEQSQAPQADRERALIRRLIDEGRTKEEVKDALVREYGPEVLAAPDGAGFDLAAWLVPAFVLIASIVGLGVTARRWTRSDRQGAEVPPALPTEDARRLDVDMSRHES